MKCKISEEKNMKYKKIYLMPIQHNFTDGWKNYKSKLFSDGYLSLSNLPIFNLNSNYKKIIILPEQRKFLTKYFFLDFLMI